ncbi:MAG: glycosyl transferase [Herpetosiphonaceae bacterium]|nr:MAG: glycosyl transferase [Herpetosiphonaceae bacterium]
MPQPVETSSAESDHQNAEKRQVEHGPGAPLPFHIPTTDPYTALEFCRQLALFLQANTDSAVGSMISTLQANNAIHPSPNTHTKPDLSVVIPVYNEEESLPELYNRLTAVLANTQLSYEIIFVDDGSSDSTNRILRSLVETDPHIIAVELARNFGHQAAISAGLEHSRGRGVIVMDADLQDPPEVLPQFIAKWQEGHDVVYAIRERRKEGWLKRAGYAAFYRTLRHIASIDIPLDSGDFCIMDRRIVDLLVHMPERNRFIRGIRSWVGLNQVGLAYERHARYAGVPKYTLKRLIYLALDGLISFSYIPLRLITIMGFAISTLSIIMAVFYFIKKLTVGLNPPGFATLIVAILFLAGVQLITLGVIGEYIGRIFEEVKRRPLYIVRRVLGRGKAQV